MTSLALLADQLAAFAREIGDAAVRLKALNRSDAALVRAFDEA